MLSGVWLGAEARAADAAGEHPPLRPRDRDWQDRGRGGEWGHEQGAREWASEWSRGGDRWGCGGDQWGRGYQWDGSWHPRAGSSWEEWRG